MKIIAMIPARMAATRFPDKPLARILGLPMIEHVRRRTQMCASLAATVVATCDREIVEVVESFGGQAVMTSDKHERCTDRIAEAALQFDADIYVNVQGDEPLILPEMIDAVVKPLLEDPELPSANLVTRITETTEFHDPNAPKVVTNCHGDLLYISREPIPSNKKFDGNDFLKLKQLGIIAFRSDFLQIFTQLEPTPLEIIESVDMNRAVEHGFRVKMVEVRGMMIGVDLPTDIDRVAKALSHDKLVGKYL